jgi:hypothetical protein
MMYVKLKGPSHVEIRTERVIQVSATLAMSVEDFYKQQDAFVANVASVLGIDPARIKVAQVVPGRRLLGRVLLQESNAKV